MRKLCQRYNLQVEFVEAVYGNSLSEEEVNKVYSSDKSISSFGRELSRGEIGCALSHKMIYEKMLSENIENALILEDDIFFDENLIKILDLESGFDEKWELILLGHHTGYSRDVDTRCSVWNRQQLDDKFTLARPCEKAYGTYGYLINKNGAKKLLSVLDTIVKPIDYYTGDSKYVNLYVVIPAPIQIYEDFSEANNMEKRKALITSASETLTLKNLVAKIIRKYDFINNMKNDLKGFFLSLKPLKIYR